MNDLPRDRRLRGRGRIGELFEKGSRATAGTILVRALPNGSDRSRLVAVAGKALGNAVKRNLLRRRIRAAFRLMREDLPAGWDFAVVARRGLAEATWPDAMKDARLAMERAAREACGRPRPEPNR